MQEMNIILKLNLDGDIRRVRLIERSFQSLQKQISSLYSLQEGSFSLKYKDDEGDQITLSDDQELNEAYSSIQRNLLRIDISINKQKEEGEGRCGRFRKWRENCKKWKEWKENKEKEGNHNHHQHPFQHPFRHHHHHHHQQQHPFQQHPFQQHPFQQHPFQPFGLMMNHIHKIANKVFGGESEQLDNVVSPFLENLLSNSDLIEVQHNHLCDGCDSPIKGTRYHCTQCSDFDFCSQCFQSDKIKTHPQHKFDEISAFNALKNALSNGELIDAFFEQIPKKEEEEKSKEVPQSNNTNQETPQPNPLEQIHQQIQQNLEQQRLEQEKLEKEILEQEKTKQRLEQERLEKERLEKERLEKERLEQQKQEEQQKSQQKPQQPLTFLGDLLFPMRNPQQVENPSPVENQQVVYPFEQKLQDLHTMGFTDRKKNILVLVQNKGDLQLAIENLLNN